MATDGPTIVSAYDRVKASVGDLDARFYGLLDACDAYAALLDELTAEQQEASAPNAELIRRFGHQRSQVDELRELLEGAPMDLLLRIQDRILMIRETEEGRFL
jgi:hypothetical protein